MTEKAELVSPVSESPDVRLAVITAPVCAAVRTAPLTVHELLPVAIVHVVPPVSGPVPVVSASETPVAAVTLAGAPAALSDCTDTANPEPAVTELPPLTLVIDS